jgi:TetR/AcrR family transcriptional regulator, transcriptional repressor for nem operon
MARERQFSETEVLDAAADTFAEHGYQSTSLALLLAATGLAKQSLYNSFGDKRALYLKALDCAAARWAGVQQLMQQAPTGRQALDVFFDQLLLQCGSGVPARQNCIVSAGLLESVDDTGIRQQLLKQWARSHELLRATVERGQKDGSVRSNLPSAELADLLMSLMSGLRVVAHTDTAAQRLQHTALLGLSVLDSPAPSRPP